MGMSSRRFLLLVAYCTCVAISGVLCQSFSPPTEDICLGDSITYTYTCVVVNSDVRFSTTWRLTPDGGVPPCDVRHNLPEIQTCGPGRVFTSSLTGQSGDSTSFTTTLSVESISENLNGTRVQCLDAGLETVGSKDICIVGGEVVPPEFLPLSISEPDVGVDECVLSVRWSEPVISCAGSVSQYVLSVTPPTSDCQSGSEDCVFVTNQTQYNLNVTASQTYNLTVRADDSCGNMGQPAKYNIDLTELLASCDVVYKYSQDDGTLQAADITWTAVHSSLPEEMEYTVVIDDGVGSTLRERVTSPNCTSTQCSYTYYPAVSSRAECGVSVEATGCVTRQTVCTEKPVYCSLVDLSSSLDEVNRLCGSVSDGVVCYSGDSVGSVAVYFCDDGYKLQGDSTRECLFGGLWNGTTPLCVPDTVVEAESSSETVSESAAIITGVVCSIVFLCVGVLLGAVSVYLIPRARGKLSGPTSPSPPPLPPAATYEEVGVSGEVTSTHKIQLSSNEAYAPPRKDNIHTSYNTAYGQVQL